MTLERDASAYEALHQAMKACEIRLTASLPDDWVSPLIDALDADPEITNVRVTREPEAVAICSGAFFGGVNSAVVIGATGFLTCISELASLNLRYQVPLLMIVSLRGDILDHQIFQEVQGRTIAPVTAALGLPSTIVDRRDKVDLIPHALVSSRVQKRPHVVWLSRAFLTGRPPER